MSGDGSPVGPHALRGEARGASMRQRVVQSMQRRAADLQGAAKQNVLARLSALADAAPSPIALAEDRIAAPASQGALRTLLDHIAGHSRTPDSLDAGQPPLPRPGVPALAEVRQLWSGLRTESQAREALAAEPTDAGPLNSAQLVHRALKLMRETSPGYLRHFLAYADALSWLAEIAPEPGKTSVSPTKGRSRSKSKPPRQRPQ